MRARTEALLSGLGLVALVGVAAVLGLRGNAAEEEDTRASTFLAGPYGARALAEALTRLGVETRPFRSNLRRLAADTVDSTSTAFVLLNPSIWLSGSEIELVRDWNDASPRHALVVAGARASPLMRCFGYADDWRGLDSVPLRPPAGAALGLWPRVGGVLAATNDSVVVDSSEISGAKVTRCAVPPISRADTLLTTATGRVVALRLTRADSGGPVLLVSDAGIFRNRALRDTPAGPFVLGLFVGRFPRVIFEEAHHGFEEGGSLWTATRDWSLESPWGWAMWQLALVGLLLVLAGAVRFGPAIHLLDRRRRSPLEHVRALATALAAAQGHDVAIEEIIEGLRRRLLP
ncbi:MAG TPA: DUF4350 domain-containing protein, partial [Gemmatimonadales bacterium]|nr:DUF4350 domain-containing protein [Gemmatimonadales bacterium]